MALVLHMLVLMIVVPGAVASVHGRCHLLPRPCADVRGRSSGRCSGFADLARFDRLITRLTNDRAGAGGAAMLLRIAVRNRC